MARYVNIGFAGAGWMLSGVVEDDLPIQKLIAQFLFELRNRNYKQQLTVYREDDLKVSLEETPQFEERYQARLKRLTENPEETWSLWGRVNAKVGADLIEMYGSRERFLQLMKDGIRPNLYQFMVEIVGVPTKTLYGFTLDSPDKYITLDEILKDKRNIGNVFGNKPSVDILGGIGMRFDDRPFPNDAVIFDITTEVNSVASEKFFKYLENSLQI